MTWEDVGHFAISRLISVWDWILMRFGRSL